MSRDSIHVIEISGDAGLRQAPDLAARLKAALAGHDRVAVRTAGMSGPDLTTVQLLLAARRQALAVGKSFTLDTPPQGALRDLLVRIGILPPDAAAPAVDADFWLPPARKTKSRAL